MNHRFPDSTLQTIVCICHDRQSKYQSIHGPDRYANTIHMANSRTRRLNGPTTHSPFFSLPNSLPFVLPFPLLLECSKDLCHELSQCSQTCSRPSGQGPSVQPPSLAQFEADLALISAASRAAQTARTFATFPYSFEISVAPQSSRGATLPSF